MSIYDKTIGQVTPSFTGSNQLRKQVSTDFKNAAGAATASVRAIDDMLTKNRAAQESILGYEGQQEQIHLELQKEGLLDELNTHLNDVSNLTTDPYERDRLLKEFIDAKLGSGIENTEAALKHAGIQYDPNTGFQRFIGDVDRAIGQVAPQQGATGAFQSAGVPQTGAAPMGGAGQPQAAISDAESADSYLGEAFLNNPGTRSQQSLGAGGGGYVSTSGKVTTVPNEELGESAKWLFLQNGFTNNEGLDINSTYGDWFNQENDKAMGPYQVRMWTGKSPNVNDATFVKASKYMPEGEEIGWHTPITMESMKALGKTFIEERGNGDITGTYAIFSKKEPQRVLQEVTGTDSLKLNDIYESYAALNNLDPSNRPEIINRLFDELEPTIIRYEGGPQMYNDLVNQGIIHDEEASPNAARELAQSNQNTISNAATAVVGALDRISTGEGSVQELQSAHYAMENQIAQELSKLDIGFGGNDYSSLYNSRKNKDDVVSSLVERGIAGAKNRKDAIKVVDTIRSEFAKQGETNVPYAVIEQIIIDAESGDFFGSTGAKRGFKPSKWFAAGGVDDKTVRSFVADMVSGRNDARDIRSKEIQRYHEIYKVHLARSIQAKEMEDRMELAAASYAASIGVPIEQVKAMDSRFQELSGRSAAHSADAQGAVRALTGLLSNRAQEIPDIREEGTVADETVDRDEFVRGIRENPEEFREGGLQGFSSLDAAGKQTAINRMEGQLREEEGIGTAGFARALMPLIHSENPVRGKYFSDERRPLSEYPEDDRRVVENQRNREKAFKDLFKVPGAAERLEAVGIEPGTEVPSGFAEFSEFLERIAVALYSGH